MSGAATRRKGRVGQLAARHLLMDHDWTVAELNGGTAVEDFISTDPTGLAWAVECKNTAAITTAHRKQAMDQAKARRMRWMLLSHIAGTSSWLVQRQGLRPVVWHEGGGFLTDDSDDDFNQVLQQVAREVEAHKEAA